MRTMDRDLPNVQLQGKTTKFMPPNIKKLDGPPTKKNRVAQPTPEVHIAVNITPTPGLGGPAMQGTYAISKSPVLQSRITSAPGPSHHNQTSNNKHAETSMGHRVHIPKTRESLLLTLLD